MSLNSNPFLIKLHFSICINKVTSGEKFIYQCYTNIVDYKRVHMKEVTSGERGLIREGIIVTSSTCITYMG